MRGFWFCWFLFNRQNPAVGVKFNHTKTLRVCYKIAKNSGALLQCGSFFQPLAKTQNMENVVAKYQTNRVLTNEAFPRRYWSG